jgi:hypothetical protein
LLVTGTSQGTNGLDSGKLFAEKTKDRNLAETVLQDLKQNHTWALTPPDFTGLKEVKNLGKNLFFLFKRFGLEKFPPPVKV